MKEGKATPCYQREKTNAGLGLSRRQDKMEQRTSSSRRGIWIYFCLYQQKGTSDIHNSTSRLTDGTFRIYTALLETHEGKHSLRSHNMTGDAQTALCIVNGKNLFLLSKEFIKDPLGTPINWTSQGLLSFVSVSLNTSHTTTLFHCSKTMQLKS